jgi:hypothetical protein
MKKLRAPFFCAALLAVTGLGAQARAQGVTQWDAGSLYASRQYLEQLLRRHEGASRDSIYSDAVRAIAKDEANLIRSRLRDGDFEVGDILTVTVAGQASYSGQFTVAPGRVIIVADLAPMPLGGLLRAELTDSLKAYFGRYVRQPQVYVQTTMRLQVFGEVGSPGYHDVSADSRLIDVLTTVGQPGRGADLDRMKIKRGKDVIWDGEALKKAITEGRTLDQLSLRAGDVIDVPAVKTRNLGQTIRDLYFLIPVTFAIMRLF